MLPELLLWLHEYVPLAQHPLGNTQTVCQSKTENYSFQILQPQMQMKKQITVITDDTLKDNFYD